MSRRRIRRNVSFDELKGKKTRSYIRESSPRQALADRYGPDIQRAGIRDFCDRFELEQPEHEYFDAVTAGK